MENPRPTAPAVIAAGLLVAAALAAFAEEPAEGAPPAAAPASAAACPGAAADAGKLAGCARPLAGIADAYEDARGKMLAFAAERSAQLEELFKKEADLKSVIEKNSAELTQLKFKGDRDSKRRIKELEKENKGLWRDLKKMDGEKSRACRDLRKAASRQAHELSKEIERQVRAAFDKME